jgi:aminoglycoside phosphotransferase (APT) family kinase protein
MCADASVLGASFSVYEFVSGEVIRNRSDLARHSPDEVRRCAFALIDVLALLHEVPYEDIGLKDFGRPQGYLGRQVSRWYEQWRRVATRELPDIDLLYSKLAGSVPRETGASIVHGDFRIDNAILDEHDVGSVRAVVDWEMATLGDPLADLALHLVYRDPIFGPVLGGSAAAVSDRMPSPTQLTERYTHASGRDVCDLNFHMALGYFKIAVIAEGIHVRHSGGFTVGEGFGTVAAAVPLLAASGLRALAGWRSG